MGEIGIFDRPNRKYLNTSLNNQDLTTDYYISEKLTSRDLSESLDTNTASELLVCKKFY